MKQKNKSKKAAERSAKRLKSSVVFFIAAAVVIAAGFFALSQYVVYENSRRVVLVSNRQENDFDKSDYSVIFTVSKQWISAGTVGAEYDAVIYNYSRNDIDDWEVKIKVPYGSYIDSSWNGVFQYNDKGDEITITPIETTNTAAAGGNQGFGMVMYTDTTFAPWDITFSFSTNRSITDYVYFYILTALAAVVIVIALIALISGIRVKRVLKRQQQYKKIIDETLDAFANVIDAKDEYTKGHSARVAHYTCELAKLMGMNEDEQENLKIIALLHDIGKVGVPDAVLNKPGRLTEEELCIIHTHTVTGNKILSNFTSVENIAAGAHYHHEKFDGTGYPDGLKGEEIPLCARIICVADSYDAMSSSRCYRKPLEKQKIIKELLDCSGTQFDPEIVPFMVELIEKGEAPIVFDNNEKPTPAEAEKPAETAGLEKTVDGENTEKAAE